MLTKVRTRQLISAALTTGVLLTATWPSGPSHAQTALPPAADAARTQSTLNAPAVTPPAEVPAVTPEQSVLPLQDAPPGAEQIPLTLTGIELSGNTIYTDEELAPLYSELIGNEIPLSQVFDVANAITLKYRNAGYILSRAVLPQQEIADGRVRIEIIEGYVGQVILQGAEHLRSRTQIERYAAAIPRQRPLNMQQIERYLLLIRDMPGHTAESLLRPAEDGRGATDLILKVTHDPAAVSIGTDNHGSKYLGPLQTSLRGQLNSVLMGGDQLTFRYVGTGTAKPYNAEELRYFEASHSSILNGEGTTLTVAASRILSHPGNTLKVIDTKSESRVLSAGLAHPVIRSRLMNLTGTAQFEMIDAGNSMAGSTLSDDRLRVLRLGGRFDYIDCWYGITQVSMTVSQGLSIFGASDPSSPELSRLGGESRFRKVNVDIARLQRLGKGFSLYAGLRTQYSSDRLLSAEEFGIGGAESGRGYDNSEVTGDTGVAGRLELQYSLEPFSIVDSSQIFAFYDVGKAFMVEAKGGDNASIASIGGGIRFNMGEHASGSFTVAQPLTREVAARSSGKNERPLRALFSFIIRY